jgi:hypothetical protein
MRNPIILGAVAGATRKDPSDEPVPGSTELPELAWPTDMMHSYVNLCNWTMTKQLTREAATTELSCGGSHHSIVYGKFCDDLVYYEQAETPVVCASLNAATTWKPTSSELNYMLKQNEKHHALNIYTFKYPSSSKIEALDCLNEMPINMKDDGVIYQCDAIKFTLKRMKK